MCRMRASGVDSYGRRAAQSRVLPKVLVDQADYSLR